MDNKKTESISNKNEKETKNKKNDILICYSKAKSKKFFTCAFILIILAGILFGMCASFTMDFISNANNALFVNNNSSHEKDINDSLPSYNIAYSNSDIPTLVEKTIPSVVAINSSLLYNTFNDDGLRTVEKTFKGSGVILGKENNELLIITNNHVVEFTDEFTVTFFDDSTAIAALKGIDADSDLALIAIPLNKLKSSTLDNINIAKVNNLNELLPGQEIIAIGNVLGYGQSITVGHISALSRSIETVSSVYDGLIQIDAAINSGNSGGALIDMNGNLIGINVAKFSESNSTGIGYAIPISKVQEVFDKLKQNKTKNIISEKEQGKIGIQAQTVTKQVSQDYDIPQGAYVFKITENGGAISSDLCEKDIITAMDGQPIKTINDLQRLLQYYKSGDTIELIVQTINNGKYQEKQISITLK